MKNLETRQLRNLRDTPILKLEIYQASRFNNPIPASHVRIHIYALVRVYIHAQSIQTPIHSHQSPLTNY